MIDMPSESDLNLTVQLSSIEGLDDETVDILTRSLQAEIEEWNVESVKPAPGSANPEGTRSSEAITVGALAVAVLPTLLPQLAQLLQSWALRNQGQTVKVKVQRGDNLIELEFPQNEPISMSKLEKFTERLSKSLPEQSDLPPETEEKQVIDQNKKDPSD